MGKKIFGAPPAPPPPPPPPPSPTSADPEAARKAQQAQDDAAASERKAKGRASTLLTGGEGLTETAPTSKRSLLGG